MEGRLDTPVPLNDTMEESFKHSIMMQDEPYKSSRMNDDLVDLSRADQDALPQDDSLFA